MGTKNTIKIKKRKLVVNDHQDHERKRYGFHSFGDPGCPCDFTGTFRDNIREFLQKCGEIEDWNVEGCPIWCTLLVDQKRSAGCGGGDGGSSGGGGEFVVPLYTIEESVKHSLQPYCDQCRCIGWSHHFVSKRRYHLIIPADNEWHKSPDKSLFDQQTHLLHGLIHCNGFGHLLSINGLEGGSKFLCGREIMDLWDRICTALRARKITVEDVAKKRSMELRLLYGVAYGHPWFGRWGYEFCNGSFGITAHNYNTAIDMLSSLNLDKIVEDSGGKDRNHMKKIIRTYRGMSETHLITIKDLLRFMLITHKASSKPHSVTKPITESVQERLPFQDVTNKPSKSSNKHNNSSSSNKVNIKNKDTDSNNENTDKHCNKIKSHSISTKKHCKYRKFSSFAAQMASRWPARRLEYAADVVVDALKEKGSGMSRQDLREAARLHIGDTGLLDFVLKSINNLIVGKYVVLRGMNLESRTLEFTIHDLGCEDVCKTSEDTSAGPIAAPLANTTTTTINMTTTATITSHITYDTPGLDVYNDVLYLYREVLLQGYDGKTITELSQLSTRAILDSKHFVKEWPLRDEEDFFLRFVCRLKPSLFEYGYEYELSQSCSLAPGELVIVPIHTTIGELKTEIECTLRDTYCLLGNFRVTEIEGLEEFEDEEVLFGVVESGAHIWVLGNGLGEGSDQLKYEGGTDSWTVDCSCGAKDDDGERMVACDICEVWQHTRCSGINDADAVPRLFLCANCNASLMPSTEQYYMEEEPEIMLGQVYSGGYMEPESMLEPVYSGGYMEPESMLEPVYSGGY